jgi:hypothetical protein
MIWDKKYKIKNYFCDKITYIPVTFYADGLTKLFLKFSNSLWCSPDPKSLPYEKGIYLCSDRIGFCSWDKCKDILFEDLR